MQVLITGGNGFIGRNLREYLSSIKGYGVFAPSRSELDLLDADAVSRYIRANRIDAVFHAANTGGDRKHAAREVLGRNLRMFFNVVRCRDSVERIIVCGSGAEYDKRIPLVQVKEEEFGVRIPADEYGFSKYIMSSYAQVAENVLSLRLFGVFGKYEDYESRFISNAIVKNLLHMPITIQQNVFFDYLYIDDCVRLIEQFMKRKPKHSTYNLSSGTRIDLVTLANKINEHSDFKSKIKVINPGLNNEYTASNSRLLEEVRGFHFTPPDKSIQSLFGYYRSILPAIDAGAIRRDPYAAKCSVKR
jgi:GDP-L-fucose synthase